MIIEKLISLIFIILLCFLFFVVFLRDGLVGYLMPNPVYIYISL